MAYPRILDISYAQSQGIDWPKLKTQDIAVIARGGQGIWKDNLFPQHYAGAQAAGVPIGIYWFYQPNMSPDYQVKTFLEVYNSLPVKPKVIALDVENIAYTETDGTKINILPPSIDAHQTWLLSWLSQTETATGSTPGIYSRKNYWDAWTRRSSAWSKYWLWVASWTQYSGAVPLLPADWQSWKVWQFEGGTGRCDGVVGPVDLNNFNGTTAEMYKFFGAEYTTTQPPVIPSDIEARIAKLEAWAAKFPTF
jgi:lysozyme